MRNQEFLDKVFVNKKLIEKIKNASYEAMESNACFDSVSDIEAQISHVSGHIDNITFLISVTPGNNNLDAYMDYPVEAVISVMFTATELCEDNVVEVIYSFEHGYDWLSENQIKLIAEYVSNVFMNHFKDKCEDLNLCVREVF